MDKDYLQSILIEEFTSRAGFTSYYSNDLEVWLYELIDDCDSDNVVFETMLRHLMEMDLERDEQYCWGNPENNPLHVLDEFKLVEYFRTNLHIS